MERIPPYNKDAEEALIGSILVGGNVSNLIVQDNDFYTNQMSILYKACSNLNERGSGIDVVTVSDELTRMGKLAEIGGAVTLSRLISNTPTSLDLEYYADIVKRLSQFRSLISVGNNIVNMGYDAKFEFDDNLQKSDDMLLELRKQSTQLSIVSPEERASSQLDRYTKLYQEGKTIALPTGFYDLDYAFGGGLYPGDLIYLGARPGMGKTTFMQQIANYIGEKKNVLFASGEMNTNAITDRDVAASLGVPISSIRYGEYEDDLMDRIIVNVSKLKDRNVYIYESNRKFNFTTSNLYQAALKVQLRYGLSLIVVDYLGLLKDKYGNNQVDRLGYISQNLKSIAMELDIPVLCAHQLSRLVEGREDKTPQLHDLRDSGNLEQDADTVIFLYRENYYGGTSGDTNVIIAKQRQGDNNVKRQIVLYFDNKTHLYQNAAHKE